MNKNSIIDYITRKINIAYRVNQKCCISFVISDDIELKNRYKNKYLQWIQVKFQMKEL